MVANEHTKTNGATVSLEEAAQTILNEGVALVALERYDSAVAAFDRLLERFGFSDDPSFRQLVAAALFNKGTSLSKLRRNDAWACRRRHRGLRRGL